MTRWIVVVALVAACKKSQQHPPSPSPSPPPAAPAHAGSSAPAAHDAAAAPAPKPQDMPAEGVPSSAIESLPREDWPCRYTETLDSADAGGTHVVTTWQYGKRNHCWIPADVAGSRAMVGCPDKQVQLDLETKAELDETYRYDAADHLIAVQTPGSTFDYSWDGDMVRGYTLDGRVYAYKTIGDGIEVTDGEQTVHVEVDQQAHVVKYQVVGATDLEPTIFTWQGPRLVELQQAGPTKVEYDCKASAK